MGNDSCPGCVWQVQLAPVHSRWLWPYSDSCERAHSALSILYWVVQVAFGLVDWLTPLGAAVMVAWLAAMSVAPGALGRLPFVRWLAVEPSRDVEAGGAVRIVGSVLERCSVG